MRYVLIALLLVFGIAAGVNAESIDLSLAVDEAAGTWQVYASTGEDSAGIADFSIDVWAEGNVAIDSSANKAPSGQVVGGMGLVPWGFGEARSNGALGLGIQAGQNTVYGAAPDANKDLGVLQGFGIVGGTATTYASIPVPPFFTQVDVSWDAPALLAAGTFTGDRGTINVRGGNQGSTTAGWNLLQGTKGAWTGPGRLMPPESVKGDSVIVGVPEPTSLVMLAMGALGLLMLRRRKV